MTTRDALRIEALSVSFNGRTVLRDVNLTVPEHGLHFLLGRSGSGKTSLLRAINRLNECFFGCRTRGQVLLRDGEHWHDVYAPQQSVEALRRRVGMVFQTPNVLPLSIARNVEMPLRVALGLSAEEAAARRDAALREVQLWDEVHHRLHAPAATLSGGQQQRLCLARALALRPEILLLDEPTASLDFKSAQRIETLLSELKTRYTLLVVSHALGQAHRLADTVWMMRDGGIEALDPAIWRDKEALLAVMDTLL